LERTLLKVTTKEKVEKVAKLVSMANNNNASLHKKEEEEKNLLMFVVMFIKLLIDTKPNLSKKTKYVVEK
jgi:hypothetical protein